MQFNIRNMTFLIEIYSLICIVVLCQSSNDIKELAVNDRFSDGQHLEILTMLRRELCSINQTVQKSCQGVCCNNSKFSIVSKRIDEKLSKNIELTCRTDKELYIQWPLQNISKESIYLVELNQKSLTHSNTNLLHIFNITRSHSIAFANLKNNTSYNVCVYLFNNIDESVLNIGCNDFLTMTDRVTFKEIPKVWMDDLKLIKRNTTSNFRGFLKWEPSEDRTCHYDVAIFTESEIIMHVYVSMPKNNFNTTLYDLEYNTSYKIKVAATNQRKSVDGPASWLIYTTPTCKEFNNNSINECPPDPPQITKVTESVSNLNKSLYDVLIKWTKPKYNPNYYHIELTNWNTKTYVGIWDISGNDTEANILNVDIGHLYEISMTADSQGGISRSTQIYRQINPRKTDLASASSLLWTILSPIFSIIFIISTALIIYRRNSKKISKRRCRYFEDFDLKFTKDVDSKSGFTVHLEDDPFEINPDNLVLSEMLGEGAFGVVRKGWIPEKGREVAVKMLKDESSVDEIKQFRQEIDMMKSVGSHAHIVSLVGYCTKSESPMMLIVEYCPCGDLLNYLRHVWDEIIYKSSDKPLPMTDMVLDDKDESELISKPTYAQLFSSKFKVEETIANFQRQNFIVNKLYDLQQNLEKNDSEDGVNLTSVDLLSFGRQIAMGMEYLSNNRVVHRDLAARNVLVCTGKTVKISDFGLSRDIYRENIYKKTGTGKLPIKWMAIESLTHQVYTTQSDVWSYGILLWEIVTLGGNPYPSIPSGRLMKLLMSDYRMERPVNCSKDLYSLMMACWQNRPKDRPTFAEIRQIIDTLLEGMCSHTYLTLDISNHKQTFEFETYNINRALHRGKNFYRTQNSNYIISCICNSDECDVCEETELDRYVTPISVKNAKMDMTTDEFNNYCNQPFVTPTNGFL